MNYIFRPCDLPKFRFSIFDFTKYIYDPVVCILFWFRYIRDNHLWLWDPLKEQKNPFLATYLMGPINHK